MLGIVPDVHNTGDFFVTDKKASLPTAVGRKNRSGQFLLAGLGVVLVVMIFVSSNFGAESIGARRVFSILISQAGLSPPWSFDEMQEFIVMEIRLPRVLLCALVGMALAVSGAAIQGLFRNPLAEPGLVGISSGAALAAASVIVLGETILRNVLEPLGLYALPIAAFMGAAIVTLLIFRVASVAGRTVVATMLLAGIAINALTNASTGVLVFLANSEQIRDITFWSLGSLAGASWEVLRIAAMGICIPCIALLFLGRALNAMLLGEAEAMHLGVSMETVKRLIIVFVSLAVGTAVAFTGFIGFVGLVVPHLMRLVAGPDNRIVLPGSALLGAVILLGADLAARTIAAPAEVPIGIITALIGAPVFLGLLLRTRKNLIL